MHRSLGAAAALAGLTLLTAAPATAAPLGSTNPVAIAAARASVAQPATVTCEPVPADSLLTPAVTDGGVFSDARDTALAGLVAMRDECAAGLHTVVDLGDQASARYYTAVLRDLDEVLHGAGYSALGTRLAGG